MTTAKTESTTMPVRLHVSFELGAKEWKLACASSLEHTPVKRVLPAGDLIRLQEVIREVKHRLSLAEESPVVSCYEAGRDGFWLHRHLSEVGIVNVMVDPTSIQVNRRARRAKTDTIDATALVRLLIRYHQGERRVWSVVYVPTVEQENSRHLHREEINLRGERTQLVNELRALLFGVGTRLPSLKYLETQLPQLRQGNGQPLSAELQGRLTRLIRRLALVERQLQEMHDERHRLIKQEKTPEVKEVRQLLSLKGIGTISSWLMVKEGLLWRNFRNRRQVASFVGLAPTPFQSGDSDKEQGISKAGNQRLRWIMVELAWSWLRYQPQSELSQWYERRFASGSPRLRKIGIVALARKLLVQLWKYLVRGEMPAGAEAVSWQKKLTCRRTQWQEAKGTQEVQVTAA